MRCPMAKCTKVSKHDFSSWAFLVNQSPALAIGALLIGLGAIVLWTVPVTRDDPRTLPLLLGGGLALLGVIAFLYPVGCWFTRSRYAEVFEEGLKCRRSFLRLLLSDGRQIRFDSAINGFDRLAAYTQRATTERLLPEAKSALEEGQEIRFGPVRLSGDGVRLNKRLYSWDEIKRMTDENGHLCLWHDGGGKLCQVAFRNVPNYRLFLSLVVASGKGKKLRGGILEESYA